MALAAVVALVLANGFFVATEFALVSVRRTRIQQLAAGGDRRARDVLGRLDHLDTYIAATQLGITLASLALGWIGEPALAHLIEPALERIPFVPHDVRVAVADTAGFALGFAIITALHIIIGELAPKSLALQRPETTALRVAGPIHGFAILFRPAIAALNGVGNAVVRLVGVEPAAGHALVQSAEELKLAIDASREAGLVDPAAEELVDHAFTFADLEVRHVMVPRTEMTTVPVDAPLDEVLRIAIDSGHMRLPVRDGDVDHIVGLLDVKRLLPLVAESLGTRVIAPFTVREVMDEPLAVPEGVPATIVLERLRAISPHFALVVDEYGGTAGMVTLEDLVEHLIGKIRGATGPLEPPPLIAADGSLLFDGLTALVELKEAYGLDLAVDDLNVETIGGYVFAKLGRAAEVGDEVISPAGWVLRVEAVDGLRVARVRALPR